MKLLLTGGTGYIGSHTAVALSQAGHEVILLDNLSNSKASVLDRLQRILGRPLAFVQADVRDTPMLAHTLQSHQVEGVIHFAGL